PSDFTTTSLGELNRLPSKRSARTVMDPSCSARVTRRVRCSQVTRRPSLSIVLPLAFSDGLRKIETAAVSSSHFIMRLLGMSDHTSMRMGAIQAGPSHHRPPLHRRSTCALPMTQALKRSSRTSYPAPSIAPNIRRPPVFQSWILAVKGLRIKERPYDLYQSS